MRTRRLSAVALAAAALALAACGDDDDASTTDVTEATGASEVTDVTEATAVTETTDAAATPTTGGTEGTGGGEFTEEDFVQAGVDDLEFGDEELERCLTQATIDAIGFDEITATGVSPEELFTENGLGAAGLSVPEERQEDLKTTVAGCGDLVELYVTEGGASEAEAACAREHLTNEVMSELFVLSFVEAEPSAELQTASDAMDACIAEG